MSKTIQQLLQSNKKIARLDAELLLAHVLGKSREWVLAHPDYEVCKVFKVIKFLKLTRKRAQDIPLAYLTKHKEFFGLDFFVNKNVLIPRPDTEIMVEEVLSLITYHITHNTPITLIDVGTGSGCIPIVIAKSIRKSGLSVIRNFFAIDISRKALRVAKINAKKHNVKINFLHGNLLSPLINQSTIKLINQSTIIITANLPYLTNEQFTQESSIQNEPRLALVAEESGLALYRELLKQIQSLLTAYSLQLTAFFEIDPNQSQSITKLIKSLLPNSEIEIKKNLAGLDRVVIIKNG